MTTLAGWENFYVIVGSSAGALIGLQFVVITLIHNAWDAVTYHVFVRRREQRETDQPSKPED
jgi:hypothetical protein